MSQQEPQQPADPPTTVWRVVCQRCDGEGRVPEPKMHANLRGGDIEAFTEMSIVTCPHCHGTGRLRMAFYSVPPSDASDG